MLAHLRPLINLALLSPSSIASHFVLLLSALSVLSASAYGSIFTHPIKAKQVFYLSHAVIQRTNASDVKGLAALQSKFTLLQSRSDDPCLGLVPWVWIQCTNDPTSPRGDLGSYCLMGSLPDFSSMDALEDFSDNFLNGSVPAFLGTLPNLQKSNLANNDFQGSLPTSILQNNKLTIVVSGNANLCASDQPCQPTSTNNQPNTTPQPSSTSSTITSNKGSGSSKLPAILGASISVFFVFWIIVGVYAILHHKRKLLAAVAIITAGQ